MGKRLVRSALIAALGLAAVPAPAPAGDLGLGVIAGEPTGVSLKLWLDGNRAVDAALGWSFSENDSLQLHADHLWHNFGLLRAGEVPGRLPVYFGIGARFKSRNDEGGGRHHRRNNDDDLLGVRFPLGIAWIAPDAPVDLFVEIVPVLDLVPDSELSLNAAIGARYWFR